MQIEIEWQKPLLLAKNRRIVFDRADAGRIADVPGVYFFSRKFGSRNLPFYIGETGYLRSRLITHLDSKKIADALRGISDGDNIKIARGFRYFNYGYLRLKRGQDWEKCIAVVQEYMIELAIAQDIPLLNIQKTVIRTHDVLFSGPAKARSIYKKHNEVIRKK